MEVLNLTSSLKILLAVDDSQGSTAAINLLSRIAWPAHTAVHVVSIVPERLPLMERSPEMQRQVDETLELMRWRAWASARLVATEAANRLKAHNLSVKTEICEGPASQRLMEQAKEMSANLVVLGAQGFCPPGHKLKLGPTAHKMAHYADSSVLVVRPSEQVRPLNTILVVDDSPETCRAVEFLGVLSLPQWARVTVVNIARANKGKLAGMGLTNRYLLPNVGQKIANVAEACTGKVIERLHEYGVQVGSTICFGRPVDEIVSAARERNADLIVMGTRDQTCPVSGLVQKVVKYAPCSVLAVRKSIAQPQESEDQYLFQVQ